MRIGYPCINWSLDCKGDRTFRLKSYSEERLVETVGNNLDCLGKVLEYNAEHGFLFFRITSDLVPFASHPVCTFDWADHFSAKFAKIGEFIRSHDIRLTASAPHDFDIMLEIKDKKSSAALAVEVAREGGRLG
jgi:UV DNA damage endonuclease